MTAASDGPRRAAEQDSGGETVVVARPVIAAVDAPPLFAAAPSALRVRPTAPTFLKRLRRANGTKIDPTIESEVEPEPEQPPRPRRLTWRERRDMGRLRARKVRRVIRHVDPWSVLKLSLLFYLCLFLVVMVAGVLLWSLASSAGTIHDVEGFIKDLGAFDTFTFEGTQIFRACVLGGLVLVVAGTGFNVLLALLFNLISDLVGGIRVTVIEEESARRTVV